MYKEVNIWIHGMPFYVIMYSTYKLLKLSILAHPAFYNGNWLSQKLKKTIMNQTVCQVGLVS